MDICGNVLVSKDVLKFALKCLYCEKDIQEWEAFVSHIQSLHYTGYEEPLIDPIAQLDFKENIAFEWVKEEEANPTTSGQWEENVNGLKMEIPSDEECLKEEPTEDPVSDNGKVSEYDDKEDSSDSNSSNEHTIRNKKPPKKFKPSFYRSNKNTSVFIEIFEKAPCLWDPYDDDYNNSTVRSNSKNEIIKQMRKRCQVTLTNKKLWESLRELYSLYKTTALAVEKKSDSKSKKLSAVVLGYFEKCSFLSAAKDDFLDILEDTPNTTTNLSFASLNTTTIAFIDTYARFPGLYDTKHADFTYVVLRKQRYKEMADILKLEHKVEFTDEEIYKGIDYLRHWYFKLKSRLAKNLKLKDLSSAAQFYVEKCSFLPDRSRREKIRCTECDKCFQTNAMKQVHLFKEHNIGDLPYKCTDCNKSFSSNAALTGHQRRNHMEKVHKCEFCERKFAVIPDLKHHMEIHTGHKPFVCELCGKAFRTRTKLGFHSNAIHLKLRAFKCSMCPKDFLKSRDLKDHIKSHLNIRDKICETCGKGFTNSHALLRHRQLHAEVKKYACKFCEKRFYQFVGMNSHMKHRHGYYPQKKFEKKTESTKLATNIEKETECTELSKPVEQKIENTSSTSNND
ncbi:zinc finger protein 560-like [Anastrepha ludens]|uniref:zinc finger protein 560-like n=1 Tax=Anastrepha ludens TaxID=28586 RepID=UPI0023AFD198|nr:zinc finger protein 560-like [Anastrepha ludens]